MNPYLRITQSARQLSFFYALTVLDSKWPETEPYSSKLPEFSAKILKEWPLGETHDTGYDYVDSVLAKMGLYVGDELWGEFWLQKWLGIDGDKFVYKTHRAHHSDISGAPNVISSPVGNHAAITHFANAGDQWTEHQRFKIQIPSVLLLDLTSVITDTYNEWNPRPPHDLQRAAASLYETLFPVRPPQPGKLSEAPHWIEGCVGMRNERIAIAYALWVWDKPMLGWEKATPIFAVVNLNTDSGRLPEEHQVDNRIFFSPQLAVQAAYSTCYSSQRPPAEKVNALIAEIQESVDEAMAPYRKLEG